jgi:metallo-beta-lactamase class B
MSRRSAAALVLGLAAAACTTFPATNDAPAWRARAGASAGEDLRPAFDHFCRQRDTESEPAEVGIPATRVFDNLVFVGRSKWNAWALLTSGGIVLFDALETEAEARHYIVEGLTSLGLDPATIRHVVVTHGHGDHFGGARLFQQRYGARIWLSQADGELMRSAAARGALRPGSTIPDQTDIVREGGRLTLGDAIVQFHLTPGHTPGSVSAIFPVRDGAARHMAGYWGGTGFAPGRTDYPAYFASIGRFRQAAGAAGVDVALSNHPTNDMTLAHLPALASRRPGRPHPFVLGREGYQRFLATLEACVHATYASADPVLRGTIRP